MAGSTFQTNPFDLNKLLDDCQHGVLQLGVPTPTLIGIAIG